MAEEELTELSSGIVKSFNPAKGFGFIQCDEVEGDVFFSAKTFAPEVKEGFLDQSFIKLDGRTVAFNLVAAPDGKPQARDVTLAPMSEQDELVGAVKSFSDKDMYGFITTPSVDQDVYFKLKFPPQIQGALKGTICRFCLKVTDEGKAQANKIFFKASSASSAGLRVPMGMMQYGASPNGMYQHMGQVMQVMGGKGMSGNGMSQNGQAQGVVKSFNMSKGFGFIQCAGVPRDIYFKSDSQIDAGTAVSFAMRMTPDGNPQASNVTPMPGEGSEAVGSIKSYNPAKGFGFLVAPGLSTDVFFKGEMLPAELQGLDEDSILGAQLQFTIHVTPDGKLQMSSASYLGTSAAPNTKRKASAMAPAPGPRPSKRTKVEAVDDVIQCVVKSYNAAKGYGFLQSPAMPGDIYFQKKLLPPEVQGLQLVGCEGSVQLGYTPDGKPQAAVLELDYSS